ncbi:lipoprotein-releasing system permease protein [Flavobacteriaceae bacterium MAR_2010_188]|nr:lipoprotein-releasing system permease protein [Flavobacteriaceae bacterium MAR_2010_188]
MNVALYIAKRYLFSKSSNNAINIMTFISAAGIIIAAAALFIVLSGFAGLKDFSLEFSSYVDPDLKVSPLKGKSFQLQKSKLAEIAKIDGIEAFTQMIEERVILEVDNKRQIVTLRGVDSNYTKVTNIDSMIFYGSWLMPKTNQLVAGRGVANNLSFGVLDFTKQLVVYVPKPGKGQITSVRGAFRSISAVNIGVFSVNEDLDQDVIYADISTAKYLMDYDENTVSSIEFKLKDSANEEQVRTQLLEVFDENIQVKNRAELNDSLYKMLNTENMAVYLIFTLVIIIALFNVIGALIMMILDKKESLNTLFNLGTTTQQIRKIFFLQGSLMTVLGGIIGTFLGLLLVFLQQQFAMVMITPSLPYPVTITLFNLIIVLVTIFVLGILASKVASARITKNLVSS